MSNLGLLSTPTGSGLDPACVGLKGVSNLGLTSGCVSEVRLTGDEGSASSTGFSWMLSLTRPTVGTIPGSGRTFGVSSRGLLSSTDLGITGIPYSTGALEFCLGREKCSEGSPFSDTLLSFLSAATGGLDLSTGWATTFDLNVVISLTWCSLCLL